MLLNTNLRLVMLILFCTISITLHSKNRNGNLKATPSDGFSVDEFGHSSSIDEKSEAIDDDYAIIGADGTDASGPDLMFADPSDAIVNSCSTEVNVPSPTTSDNLVPNNGALAFNGSFGVVRIPSPYQNTGAATTEGWIKTSSLNRSLPLFGNIYISRFSNDGKVYAFFDGSSGNGDTPVNQSTTNIADGQWHHIAATNDGSTTRLYIDGVLEVSFADAFVFNSNPQGVGGNRLDNFDILNGQLDEARFWNRALSQSEILSMKDRSLAGTEPGLTAYYDFEDGTGSSVLTDKSGNGIDGNLYNMNTSTAWVTSDVPVTTVSLTNDFTGTAYASGTYPVGQTIITWTAINASGNQVTLAQTINAGDTQGPNLTFSDPNDATIDSCITQVVVPTPEVSDNCSTNDFALEFDGVDDIVTVNQSIGSFKTIEFWMYTENGINGSEEFDYLFSFNNSNLKYIGTGNFTSSYTNETLSMVTNFGQIMTTFEEIPPGWNHIAFTGNGSAFDKIIINGDNKPVVNNGFPTVFEATTTHMGQNPAAAASRFNGKLDEVRFWNNARTAQDIVNNYEKIIDASTTDLLAYYDFEDGPGSSILSNKTGNGAHGVLNNMDINTDWVVSDAPIASVTLTNDFNGTSDASGTYPQGQTIVTWTAVDAIGNTNTLQQTIAVGGLERTWNGSVSNDWDDANNWTPNGVPKVCSDIVILATSNAPTISGNKTIEDLSINSGSNLLVPTGESLNILGDLNMYSISNLYSGLIVNGTITVDGIAKYHRFTNSQSNDNDLISPPLSGQTWSSFLTSDANYNAGLIFNNGANPVTTYLFGPYEKGTTDDYLLYTDNTDELLVSGKGYRAASNSVNGEALIFTGSILTGVLNREIVDDATGSFPEWNLIGNPYPAYIDVGIFLNHIGSVSGVSNLSLLDENTAAIYGYDADENDVTGSNWTITNLIEGPALIAPGQGFFVSSENPSANLEFTPDMQVVGNSDDFIQGRSSEQIDFIKVRMQNETSSAQTSIYFHDNASSGLDKGYDASNFGSYVSGFGLYSHLVQNNEDVPMAIQTLHSIAINDITIPLGVHANQGEQITFSIAASTLPASINVYLDDTLTGNMTLLNTSNYTITPTTNLSGTGRFYLRISQDVLSTNDDKIEAVDISVLNTSKELIVNGQLMPDTKLILFDMQGRKVMSMQLDDSILNNRIDVSYLSSGVYVVNVQNNSQQKIQKVIIK